MHEQLKKALAIFAKRPHPGRVKTRLSPPLSTEEAASLYLCMLQDVLVKGAGLPGVQKLIFYEPDPEAASFFADIAPEIPCSPQKGHDLGERMANAFRDLFARGYGHVALIGTDLPDLPPSHIEEAFRLLEKGGCDVVLGPSEDGGYYLVGMRMLHRRIFHDVPWSTEEVMAKTLARAEEAGIAVSLAPTWHDVDAAEDLLRPELLIERNGADLTRTFITNHLAGLLGLPQPRAGKTA